MSFFKELKRRNVIRVGIAYAIAAWFILQLSDLVLENIVAPDWVMQVIMLLLGIGLPIVVIFAWAFEMTPEGIKKEKDVDRSQSITSMTGRKLDRMIIGILTVVVGYLLIDKLVLQDTAPSPVASTEIVGSEAEVEDPVETGPSVAVLPFVNMSGDANNEYFSDGLTETLLHMLAQLPELRVAARTSSFAFKGKDTGIAEISETLGVAHILEGSVQKSGNRVRITAQLIRAEDGFHVWSQNYDRTLDDIFAIQDEIATDVAMALDTSLLGSSTIALQGVSTNNTEAYDLYLQALEQQAIFSYTSLGTAETLLKNALAIDPGFVDAKLALAENYQRKFGTGLINSQSAWQSIEPLLLQVESIQPGDSLARALTLNFRLQNFSTSVVADDREAVVNELRLLLPKIPDDTWAREIVANTLRFYDAFDDALEVTQAGLMLDPLSADLHETLGQIYLDMENYEESRTAFSRAMELAPENPNIYSRLGDLAMETGDLKTGLDWSRQAIEKDPQDHELVAKLATDLFLLGLVEEGAHWAARCYALAAHTTVCRRVQLDEARARNDNALSLKLATTMLRDDVDIRRFGFTRALFSYSDLMTEQGKAGEAFEFLASLYPGMDDFETAPDNFKLVMVRQAGVELMSRFAPRDQFLTAFEFMDEQQRAAKLPWLSSPRSRIRRHLLRGEIDQAKTIALEEDLSRELSNNLSERNRYGSPIFRDLSQLPEVAARLRERDIELAALQNEVETMMLNPEWNQ